MECEGGGAEEATMSKGLRPVSQTSLCNRVEPPNKGHFGDNMNSVVLSLVERVSSSRRFSTYRNYGGMVVFWDLEECPFLRGSLLEV